MERHPEYKFRISKVDKDSKWIFIEDFENSGWESDLFQLFEGTGPVEFIYRIMDDTGWKVKDNDDGYYFEEDPLKLVFQVDDLFGFTIAYQNELNIKDAMQFLEKYTI